VFGQRRLRDPFTQGPDGAHRRMSAGCTPTKIEPVSALLAVALLLAATDT